MTTSAVTRSIGDGLSRVGTSSGSAGFAVPEWHTAKTLVKAINKVIQLVRQWRQRERTIQTLSMLSDYHLNDIGIERGSIPSIARKMASARK